MKLKTNSMMAVAETTACVILAGMCVSLALDGHLIAWGFGLGSLSFAWDLWRRFGKAKSSSAATGKRER